MPGRVRCRMHFWLVVPALLSGTSGGTEPPAPDATRLEQSFQKSIRPFLEANCLGCHGAAKPKGDLDLSPFTTLDAVAKDHKRWELVLDRLRAGDMPPTAKEQPSTGSRVRSDGDSGL